MQTLIDGTIRGRNTNKLCDRGISWTMLVCRGPVSRGCAAGSIRSLRSWWPPWAAVDLRAYRAGFGVFHFSNETFGRQDWSSKRVVKRGCQERRRFDDPSLTAFFKTHVEHIDDPGPDLLREPPRATVTSISAHPTSTCAALVDVRPNSTNEWGCRLKHKCLW